MNYFKTSEIAKSVKVHPNTVRLYEKLGLIQAVQRGKNGYRKFTLSHIEQMRLARLALRCGFVAGNIRTFAYKIIYASKEEKYEEALDLAYSYLKHIQKERERALEALVLVEKWLNGQLEEKNDEVYVKRSDVAKLLNISIDVLRNYERNHLIEIPRNPKNGYRLYGHKEIIRLKIIRTLRSANYSMMAILRMMEQIDHGRIDNYQNSIDTPLKTDDVVYATDRWISTLNETEQNAYEIIQQLIKMKK